MAPSARETLVSESELCSVLTAAAAGFYDSDHILFFLRNGRRQTGKTLRLGTLTSIFYGWKEHMLLPGTLWLCNVCKTVTGDASRSGRVRARRE